MNVKFLINLVLIVSAFAVFITANAACGIDIYLMIILLGISFVTTYLYEKKNEEKFKTNEKILSEALTSKEKIETLLNQTNLLANIGGWSVDIESGELWWSDQTYRIHELPVGSDITVEQAINYYAEEYRPIISGAVESSIKEGKTWDLELELVTCKGRRLWVNAISECVTNAQGKKILRGTFQDITEKRANRLALEKARDEALDAARAKSQFLAHMSHEIRTPMNGVLGSAELLAEEELTAKQKKYVDTIIESGETMIHILNDILDFSKIDSGKAALDTHEFDLHKMLQCIHSLYEKSAKEKNIQFDLKIADNVPTQIKFDSNRLKQILANLINNAIKFTAEGFVHLKVKVIAQELKVNECEILFEVEDSGIGIAEDEIKKLFLEFSQVDASTTRHYGGTGLGLAISQKIAALFNSKIYVDSKVGEGTRFYFSIRAQLCTQNEKSVIDEPKRAVPEDYGCKRVLLVEDNKINRDVAIAFLSRFGITPEIACNGRDAVSMTVENAYDIIFMDCQMPVLDGFEATKQIRAMNLAKQPIIFAMTANTMNDNKDKCISVGMNDYITKPISIQKIAETLAKWIKD